MDKVARRINFVGDHCLYFIYLFFFFGTKITFHFISVQLRDEVRWCGLQETTRKRKFHNFVVTIRTR